MRNNQRSREPLRGKILIFGIVLLMGIFISLTFVSGDIYSRSSPRYTQPGMSSFDYLRGENVNIYPILDKEKCGVGQDFIIQVAPEGCTPSVIRSDLLEEQNVPIFCPLMATKVNPLIDVEAIDYITFKGNYPKGVSGIGFHPANSALKTSAKEMLNSPVMENIGYAVVVLNQQKNESAMPEWIVGNMTAVLRYDVDNAFGVGASQYNLPLMDNEASWEDDYREYGFWKGKGYLRAENIGVDSARVSIFRDVDTRISSVNLKVGETSDMIYIPGYYCLAGFQLRLDGLESPDTRAKFEVEGDYSEVAKGENFLDNKCQVRGLEKQGLFEEVSVSCDADDGRDNFKLEISPNITLNIDNKDNVNVGVGDILYTQSDGRNVFLGFIGEMKHNKEKFIIPVITQDTSKEQFLNSLDKKLVVKYGHNLEEGEKKTGIAPIRGLVSATKSVGVSTARITEGFVRGSDFANPIFLDGGLTDVKFLSKDSAEFMKNVGNFISGLTKLEIRKWVSEDHKISFVGFVGPVDKYIDEDFQKYFDQAKQNYRKLVDQFEDERIDLGNSEVKGNTYAEQGLFELIEFAKNSEQKKTMMELSEEFLEKYPESDNFEAVENYFNSKVKNSNAGINTRDVYINGRLETISFEGIYEPTFEDYGADVKISGNVNINSEELGKEEIYYLGDSEDYIQLKKVEEDYVEIYSSVKTKGSNKIEVETSRIKFNNDYANLGKGAYTISVNSINLKKEAKVKLLPKILNGETEANFNFKIGIEKRAIQLSPEKIASKISNLDDQLEKWGKISEGLDKTVKGLNTACLGTGAALTIKNLLFNSGSAIAREKVMRGESGNGGWYNYCVQEKEKTSVSIDQCLYANADKIDSQVEEMANRVDVVNDGMEKYKTFEPTIGGDIVNDDLYVKDYSKDIRTGLPTTLEGVDMNKVKTALTLDGYNQSYFYKDDLRDIDLYSGIIKTTSDADLKQKSEKELGVILSRIEKTSGNFAERSSFANDLNVESSKVGFFEVGANAKAVNYEGLKLSDVKSVFPNPALPDDTPIYAAYGSNGEKYIMILDGTLGEKLPIKKIGDVSMIYDSKGNVVSNVPEEFKNVYFQRFDESSYKHEFVDAKIQYYETEPYKGWPATVPFDLKNGWYAAVRQSLPSGGNIQAYDESGRVASFYLCNVGDNGRAEFHIGINDDNCQGFNIADGKVYGTFPGLNEGKTKDLVQKAIYAIKTAQKDYKKGVKNIEIGGQKVSVGGAMTSIPEIQCADFMSPKECHLLFNVCDPVVCPSSRCDLGGNYPVENVIQTGIIGGLTLCSQNFDGGKGVILPVCLSGINAGVDSLLTMSKSYKDCLTESLNTGNQVGICDEIHSIYMCEFLWKQAIPFAKLGIPKLLETVSGQNSKGGGEYLSVASAWDNAGKSVDYFKDYYGANSYQAFKYRSTEDVGTDVCKLSLSATVPIGGDFIDSLTEPVSPVQYHARFDEIPFTTATNPPISHYKVFYYIYAGKDIGAYYNVYLKGSEGTALYQDNPVLKIAEGYIGVGEPVTETKDFTAAAGYKQLCVSVNAQETCGFKEVSTSFAVDYVRAKYLEEQTSKTDITKESECISGSSSAYSLLNPNLEEGLDEMINPDLYNNGIVRICSTDSPGAGTDLKDGTEDAQWMSVGYCGDKDLQCWLDTSSVSKAINIDYIEENSLNEVTKKYQEMLAGNYMTEAEYSQFKSELEGMDGKEDGELKDIIVKINSNYDKVFLTNQKAGLTYYLANANKFLAEKIKIIFNNKATEDKSGTGGVGETETKTGTETGAGDNTKAVVSLDEYQIDIGNKIIAIARQIKSESFGDVSDSDVKKDTAIDNFECLVLMQAYQESGLKHCKYPIQEDNSLYCDGDLSKVLKAGGLEESYGTMQINTKVHSNVNVADFNTNVKYGINYLVDLHIKAGSSERLYTCMNIKYSGWNLALRYYNGWAPNDCSSGDSNYVTHVLANSAIIAKNFPEVCGDISMKVEGFGTFDSTGLTKTSLIKEAELSKKVSGKYNKINKVEMGYTSGIYLLINKVSSQVNNIPVFPKLNFKVEWQNPNTGNIIILHSGESIGETLEVPLNSGLFNDAKNGDVYKYRIIAQGDNTYEVLEGEVSVIVNIGEITTSKSNSELENILSATKCENCGGSTFDWNVCDEEECLAIGNVLGKNCVFEKGSILPGGNCIIHIPYTLGVKDADGFAKILKDGKDINFEMDLDDGTIYYKGNSILWFLNNEYQSYGEGYKILTGANLEIANDIKDNYFFKGGKFVKK